MQIVKAELIQSFDSEDFNQQIKQFFSTNQIQSLNNWKIHNLTTATNDNRINYSVLIEYESP
jgi:hypothetical protein